MRICRAEHFSLFLRNFELFCLSALKFSCMTIGAKCQISWQKLPNFFA